MLINFTAYYRRSSSYGQGVCVPTVTAWNSLGLETHKNEDGPNQDESGSTAFHFCSWTKVRKSSLVRAPWYFRKTPSLQLKNTHTGTQLHFLWEHHIDWHPIKNRHVFGCLQLLTVNGE